MMKIIKKLMIGRILDMRNNRALFFKLICFRNVSFFQWLWQYSVGTDVELY